jgi:hypothetical protein
MHFTDAAVILVGKHEIENSSEVVLKAALVCTLKDSVLGKCQFKPQAGPLAALVGSLLQNFTNSDYKKYFNNIPFSRQDSA